MPNINDAITGRPDKDRLNKKKKRIARAAAIGKGRPQNINELTDLVMQICDILELEVE
jgi:hypothetical protein